MSKILTKNIISFKDFRVDSQKYIDKVEKGESFLVLKRSKPVFKIIPVEEKWETLGDFSKEPGGGIDAEVLLKALRDSIKNKK